MPRLACFKCGRTLWATVPLASLFAEERRCPRCGAALSDDRRLYNRRLVARRQTRMGQSPTGEERRAENRREAERRKVGGS
jgi:ribosomal protein S27AE